MDQLCYCCIAEKDVASLSLGFFFLPNLSKQPRSRSQVYLYFWHMSPTSRQRELSRKNLYRFSSCSWYNINSCLKREGTLKCVQSFLGGSRCFEKLGDRYYRLLLFVLVARLSVVATMKNKETPCCCWQKANIDCSNVETFYVIWWHRNGNRKKEIRLPKYFKYAYLNASS